MKTGRIYNDKENIDTNGVKNFYEQRAKNTKSLKAVLLNERLPSNAAVVRNKTEFENLKRYLGDKRYNVLDIGCGMGRWAENLQDKYIISYDGIDFSQNFIKNAKEKFKDDKRISFYQMSATKLDNEKLKNKYDLIIITGACMYINDEDLPMLFKNIDELLECGGILYLQESVSVLNERLTLKDFYSDELQCNYSAIYRTIDEYGAILESMENFEFLVDLHSDNIRGGGLLLTKETGARDETNAYWWVIKKKEGDEK